jgi:predicted ATP-grasp superfamily ATP-dependent carboligase
MKSAHGWRASHPVYVAEADTMGALGVIRSLGRAGYPVHAVASSSQALGFDSAYATRKAVSPAYADPAFISWFRDYARKNAIAAVIPSEGLLLALKPVLNEFASLLHFSSDPAVLYAGLSKYDLFALTRKQNTPPTLTIDLEKGELPSLESLAELGTPVFIKVDGVYAYQGGRGDVFRVATPEQALQKLEGLSKTHARAVVQGYVPGRGVGAFFAVSGGKIVAEFMHLRLHEVPHTGGVSSLRRSFYHREIHDDAAERLRTLKWEGPAMLEYRWDETSGRFYLMEMNGRFWGSLHLALHSGVDFPRLLLDAHFGHAEDAPPAYSPNLRCRHTFPLEAQYVWSRLKDSSLSWSARTWSVLEFFTLALDPRVKSDLMYPGDHRLYWVGLSRFAGSTLKAVRKRFL